MISVAVSDRCVIVSGHAGYAPPGNDIICAAVSALTQSLASSLEALAEDKINTEIENGYVRIEYENLSEPGRLLVDSFFIGICGERVSEIYPDRLAGRHGQDWNPRAIAPQLQRAFSVSKVASEGLMRTEMCRVQIEAQRQSYDENGIDEFEYMAHAGCCGICAGMNGKVFKVKKMIVGDNAPPMHLNCRCSTAAYVDRNSIDWLNDDNMAELIDKSGYYQLGAGKRNSKSNTTRC